METAYGSKAVGGEPPKEIDYHFYGAQLNAINRIEAERFPALSIRTYG